MPGRSVRIDRGGAPSVAGGRGEATRAHSADVDGRPAVELYETSIRHSRRGAVRHDVGASSYWWLCDVDGVQVDADGAAALAGFPAWTKRLAAIRPADLDIRSDRNFGQAVREKARELLAERPGTPSPAPDVDGPALLACTGRVAGFGFDPLSVVWLHTAAGAPSAVLAIVRNTYGGLHHYAVLPDARGRAKVPKSFYVSPFNDVGGTYTLDVPTPGDEIYVGIRLRRDGEPDFLASVSGKRKQATLRALLGIAAKRPLEPLAVAAKIRAHGIYLWARRLPIYPVPPQDTAEGRRQSGVPAPPTGPVTAVLAIGTKVLLAGLAARMPVRIEYPNGRVLGAGKNSPSAPRMIIHRPAQFHARVGRRASIGLGESYMAGEWTSGEMPSLLAQFAARQETLVPRPLRMLRRFYIPRPPADDDASAANARSNISAHYDLSNEFFALFLDRTMTYSSGLFASLPKRRGRLEVDGRPPSYVEEKPRYDDLAPAQEAKIDALLDAAGVQEGSRVLEIGTGWGELCLRAARRGATVRSITLSTEQQRLATERAVDAGLGDQINVELRDYREIDGEYDAVLSVEMIEAVGLEYLGEYFRAIDRVLAPGGSVAIQAILMDDERVRTTRNNYTWMHKYVFPGGRIPSVRAIERALRGTSLQLGERAHFGVHYAETLRLWEDRFTARAADVRELGFDDTFIRMWRFYLQYCEAGFRSGYLDVAHLTLGRGE